MTKALVTGGMGFVGRHLGEALVQQGADVTVLDTKSEEEAQRRAPWLSKAVYVRGNVADPETIEGLMRAGPDIVYHLASVVGVEHYCRSPLDVIDVNVLGSRNVFQAAAQRGVRVLFTSTSEIYGKNTQIPWSEDHDRVLGPTRLGRWSYSTSKALCEHMLYALHESRGLPFTIVRFFNLYGPGQEPIFAVPAMMERVASGKPPVVLDSGRQTRCFTFVHDAIAGTLKASTMKSGVGEAFNLGSTAPTTILDLARLILRVAGAERLGVEHVNGTEKYGSVYEDLEHRVPSTEKAERILGWRASTPLEDGLQKTFSWYKGVGR